MDAVRAGACGRESTRRRPSEFRGQKGGSGRVDALVAGGCGGGVVGGSVGGGWRRRW